jgi:hypothetical protein
VREDSLIQKIENLRAVSANLLLNQGYAFALDGNLEEIFPRLRYCSLAVGEHMLHLINFS